MSTDACTPELYVPPDIAYARRKWGASCGPVAFAALLGKPVMDVKRCFPIPGLGTSRKQIDFAFRAAVAENWIVRFDRIGRGVPRHGLMAVTCPDDRKPIFNHAVALAGELIFDVNYSSRWLPLAEWEQLVLPLLNEFRSPHWRVVDAWEVAL